MSDEPTGNTINESHQSLECHKRVIQYYWPFLILLPTSVMFLVMDTMLAISSGGFDSPDYIDTTIRFGWTPGFFAFLMMMLSGTIMLLLAFLQWIWDIIWMEKGSGAWIWQGLIWLLAGMLVHPWVLSIPWDVIARQFVKNEFQP